MQIRAARNTPLQKSLSVSRTASAVLKAKRSQALLKAAAMKAARPVAANALASPRSLVTRATQQRQAVRTAVDTVMAQRGVVQQNDEIRQREAVQQAQTREEAALKRQAYQDVQQMAARELAKQNAINPHWPHNAGWAPQVSTITSAQSPSAIVVNVPNIPLPPPRVQVTPTTSTYPTVPAKVPVPIVRRGALPPPRGAQPFPGAAAPGLPKPAQAAQVQQKEATGGVSPWHILAAAGAVFALWSRRKK